MAVLHKGNDMKMICDFASFYILFLLLSSAYVSCQFKSFVDLKTALMNDDVDEYKSLPYQEDDKYTETGSAVIVYVRVILVDALKATKDGVDVTLHLQAFWNDRRLMFNSTSRNNTYTLTTALIAKVWTPSTYIEPEWNAGNAHSTTIRIFPNGTLARSMRVQTTIPCDIESYGLTDFRLGCISRIVSYSHGVDEVQLVWYRLEAIRVLKEAKRQGKGTLNQATHAECVWSAFPELQSPCLEIQLYVTITFDWVFVHMYIPSFFAVLMAWSSFWIHRDEVSARIKLGTLVVWTVVTEFITIGYSYPEYLTVPVGNIWMIGCLSFTWLSFFLYVIVHVVRRREKARIKQDLELKYKKAEEEKKTGERAMSITSLHPDGTAEEKTVGYSVWEKKTVTRWRFHGYTSFQVDRLCRIWFGIAFTAFNVTFWVYFRVRRYIEY